tara:strand:+ start:7550 stop:10243 length:2694 start_codon:yes stop_codon:yes gene_type:complete
MVQFLKSKGTSFVNKPVGVNNVNTGAVEAGQTLARVSQNLATQFLADAEQEQIKLGKEIGMTLPVRDEDGNLSFQTTPTTLSDVAKNAAEPIIRKRYEDALNVDLYAKINEIRQKSRTSGEFSKNVENEMSVYIEQTKQSGGQEYVSGMTETLAKLSAQHFNAMATEETKEAMRIASLQANQINNFNIADLTSIAADQINKANIGELDNVLEDLESNAQAIVEQNNNNLVTNNLAVDTHRKTDTSAKTAVSFALVNVLTKDKTPAQIHEIENYFRTGTLPKDLTNKEIVLLNKIESSPYRNEVKKYVSGVQDKVSETQRQIYADANRKVLEDQRQITKYRNDPTIYQHSQQFKSQFQMELQSIHNEVFANGGVITEEQKTKIRNAETQLFKATDRTGIVINGKRILLTKGEVMNALSQSVIMGLENTIVQSQLFKTGDDLGKLQNALYQRDPSLLNTEQKKVYDTVISVSGASLQKDAIVFATGKAINDNITSANRADANIAENQITTNTMRNADGFGDKNFGNTTKEQDILSKGHNISAAYFQQEFEEELRTGTPRALKIDAQMARGNFSSAFVNFMDNALNGRNDGEITRAINYFQKYSQVLEGGIRVDKMYGAVSEETYALYSIAKKLIPAFRGKRTFFDVEGANGGPVTQAQMLTKIKQVYQDRIKPESISNFKSNLKTIIGKEKNSFDYLVNTLGFDRTEARDLQYIVDMSASMNLTKKLTDEILTASKEGIYLDGENTVIDFYAGGDDSFRSKYALKAIFTNGEDGFARSVIQSKLNQLEHFVEKVDAKGKLVKRPVGSFTLMFKPTQVIDGYVQYSTGTATGEVKPDVLDTPVYLQPIGYGSRKDDVRYVAVTKKGNFYRPIRLPTGALMAFDAKELRRGGSTAEVGGIE